jgi:pimeloyl-ACP methyl ester carboxylesterase
MKLGNNKGSKIASLSLSLLSLSCAGLLLVHGPPSEAQQFEDLQMAGKPLTLQAVGSFFVGGRSVRQSPEEVGLYSGGPIVIDQMYVQYMVPSVRTMPPIVMVHGGVLTGKSYETTPDGRMGWYEYFVRNGFPTYVVDQVGRGRSGFNQAPFNAVRSGINDPKSQPNMRRVASDMALVRFRATTADGQAFSDTQFPLEAAGELAKQTVPDLYEALPEDNPNFATLAKLAGMLDRAIILGHSQAGQYGFEAALRNPGRIRAIIAIEPPGCKAQAYSQRELAQLAKIPILVIFGDHLDAPQKVGLNWNEAFKDCEAFMRRMHSVRGDATLLHTPDLGIHGNSHMLMQDRNNLQIADLIIGWLKQKIR